MELRNLFVVLAAAVVSLVRAGRHDVYSGNTIHGLKLRDDSDLELLQELVDQLDVDIWQYGMPAQRDAFVMVTPENKDAFLQTLDDKGIEHYVDVKDVAKSLEDHDQKLSAWRSGKDSRMIFQGYPRYADIDAYMEFLASQYPNLVTVVNAGQSFEGRDMKYLQISTSNFSNNSKPIYFMGAMLHAREWVTTPVTLYSIHRLVENLRAEDSDLLDDVDWIIMPLVNPDGYEYSHTTERLWRKTRSVNLTISDNCIGVDGNRNFDVAFNTTGVSTNPCAMTYPGPFPFSEPETGFVRDILLQYVNRIQIYLDIHSHGNYVLFAYGDNNLPPNAHQVHQVGAAMGAAIDALKLPQVGYYLVGNSGRVLYSTSGSAQDYGQIVGVPFSYTLELPGYGFGFLVPPEYQDQINEETWRGIAASARLARTYYNARLSAQPYAEF